MNAPTLTLGICAGAGGLAFLLALSVHLGRVGTNKYQPFTSNEAIARARFEAYQRWAAKENNLVRRVAYVGGAAFLGCGLAFLVVGSLTGALTRTIS